LLGGALNVPSQQLLKRVKRVAVLSNEQRHVIRIALCPDVDVRGALHHYALGPRVDSHGREEPVHEGQGHLTLLSGVLFDGQRLVAASHTNHGRLGVQPEEPASGLLDDLDQRLLLAETELIEGGVDRFLNACGASFDLLHHALPCHLCPCPPFFPTHRCQSPRPLLRPGPSVRTTDFQIADHPAPSRQAEAAGPSPSRLPHPPPWSSPLPP